MWRLWNYLFGWDYVSVHWGFYSYICRVHRDYEGRPYVMMSDGRVVFLEGREYYPLTFPRSKGE